jgi:hypothetical protein
MPRVGFEPMIPVREREKILRALDHVATFYGAETFISFNPWRIQKQTLDGGCDIHMDIGSSIFLSTLGFEPVSYSTVAIRSCVDKKLLYNPSCLTLVQYYVQQRCTNKTNSVASVREGTIPTERPPLVGEVSANFSG